MMPGIPDNMRELALKAASRDYPRTCQNRGEIVAMIEDDELPNGIRLKQWACRYWGDGATWKTCQYRSKKFHCNERIPIAGTHGE